VVGGVSTALRGGKLGAGFLAGAFANLASTVIGNMPGGPIAQTVASAVAGGAGAKLGGGKFANGAITGAFSYLFNHAMHYASGDPKYHHYTYKTPICRASVECTKEIVFDGLRRYPAPGHDSRTLVEDGDVTAIAPAGVVGDAWHAVDPANYTVSNITLPNHMFHSGIVVRSVVQENGIVYVQTHGEGTGNWGGFNEAIGSAAMAKLDQDIRIYLHRKTYMARDRFPGY
ncbi:MAG: hypothetical protein OEU56_24775, partial [Rhodospirillales bacterium]|nr:hypothetical protein [Rhodospirillales bacterium]